MMKSIKIIYFSLEKKDFTFQMNFHQGVPMHWSSLETLSTLMSTQKTVVKAFSLMSLFGNNCIQKLCCGKSIMMLKNTIQEWNFFNIEFRNGGSRRDTIYRKWLASDVHDIGESRDDDIPQADDLKEKAQKIRSLIPQMIKRLQLALLGPPFLKKKKKVKCTA